MMYNVINNEDRRKELNTSMAKVIHSYDEFLRIYLPNKYKEMIADREKREANRKWRFRKPSGGRSNE